MPYPAHVLQTGSLVDGGECPVHQGPRRRRPRQSSPAARVAIRIRGGKPLNPFGSHFVNQQSLRRTGQGGDIKMKSPFLSTICAIAFIALLSGCASLQIWQDHEIGTESNMVSIQEKIGSGLADGALTPDQSQGFLTELKIIRTDYNELKGTRSYREQWHVMDARIRSLSNDIDVAIARKNTNTDPQIGDRILILQRKIDDGSIGRRLSQVEEREEQAKLDAIRSDYLRMTDGGGVVTQTQRVEISRRLDSLEMELH